VRVIKLLNSEMSARTTPVNSIATGLKSEVKEIGLFASLRQTSSREVETHLRLRFAPKLESGEVARVGKEAGLTDCAEDPSRLRGSHR
jgi:hypothetical protein